MAYETVQGEKLTLVERPQPGRDFGFYHFRTRNGKSIVALEGEFKEQRNGEFWSLPYQVWIPSNHREAICAV